MNNDEFKVMLERIDAVQNTVNRIDKDLEADRRDLQDFSIRLGKVETVVDEVKKSMWQVSSRTQDRVSEAVAPMIEETQHLREEIDKKRTLILKAKSKWRFWKRG